MHVCALANINRRMQRLYTMVPSEHRHRCVIPREAHWTPIATQGRNNMIDLICGGIKIITLRTDHMHQAVLETSLYGDKLAWY